MTGAELILKERQEQLDKHNYSIETDVRNNDMGQLKWAAQAIITELDEDWPEDWNRTYFDKIMDKSPAERLGIAGALLAAEIDRLNAIDAE